MKRALVSVWCGVVLALHCAAAATTATQPVKVSSTPVYDDSHRADSARGGDESGFHLGETGLTPSQRAGREIWYKAAAGNDRFHTYVFQQRLGVLIDWYRVLRSDQRDDRFKAWGLINDPSCCVPGSTNCPAKSYEETFGFDWCPGDDALLQSVGKPGYRDPACDFKDAPLAEGEVHGPNDQRQSPCDLAFGTSTGALGLRKFPNPKFNLEQWRRLNGKLGTWEGYDKKLSAQQESSDSQTSHLIDPSIEPPFRVGMACGACHISFDPAHPPKDPAHPQWENIKGLLGNQYSRLSEVMVSGMGKNSLEWQVFSHARPGTTDTSAVPTDQVNNPGTMNALINIKQRPTFSNEAVNKWRKVKACDSGESETACWCEPGKSGKCWRKSLQSEVVHHILKGGEDSIGASEALQRVFINIGSCSEQCWVNHLTDLRQLDPQQRNFGQTPFDIGQCRRDCANFRAVEDRLPNVLDFVLSAEGGTADLQRARETVTKTKNPGARYDRNDLTDDLEKEFGKGAVSRGRLVFSENCARCHSSIPESVDGPFKNRDFLKVSEKTGLRADWMGSDQATPVSEVGTFRCRALHSNHIAGHVWQEYASDTYRARAGDPNVREPGDGGRGYYRNVSLLNAWAHAPFMHNNAMGPELCGGAANAQNDFYRPPYVDDKGAPLLNAPACWPYDPSVDGRFKLYKESMRQLLHPKERVSKITKLDQDIVLDIGPKIFDGQDEKKLFGLTITVPKGTNAGLLGNFQHKQFIVDLVLSKTQPQQLETKLTRSLGKEKAKEVAAQMREVADEILRDPAHLIKAVGKRLPLVLDVYSSCTADVEDTGHRFGEDLPEPDKQALTAFLATL